MTFSFSFLRGVELFSGLSDQELRELAALTTTRRFKKNSAIILAEEEGEEFFIICQGQVKVSILHEDGREIILSILGPGEVFGELSLLDGKPRSANVIALQDTELITLSRAHFLALIHRKPRLATAMLAELASRLRQTDYQIGNLALLNVTNRVAKTLLRLATEQGIETPQGVLLKNRPTHHQLAQMAGTTRETVTRVINRLEQEGYLVCRGRELLILKEEGDTQRE